MIFSNFKKYCCTMCGICVFHKPINENYNDIIKKKFYKNEIKNFCPGYGLDRKKIKVNSSNFSLLVGNIYNFYVGYSLNKKQRISSSSGGVLTEIIIDLLHKGILDGFCMPFPTTDTETEYVYKICTKKDISKIRKFNQSIYFKIPAFGIVNQIRQFNGTLGFVGLPDQITSIRFLAKKDFQLKKKLKLFIGPMTGIMMQKEVIDILPKIANTDNKIKKLRWRYGEWPGKLYVKFANKVLKIDKFYYNYLLPFFCSHESLVSDDFSNELADISVGDAWLPEYENLKKGWSLISTKSAYGEKIIKELKIKKKIFIENISYEKALSMHEHMIDFKKRGSQYRKKILNFFFIPSPKNFNFNLKFRLSRFFIEFIILGTVKFSQISFIKFMIPYVNQNLLGYVFSILRIFWKNLTKKIKRKDLYSDDYIKKNY